MIIIYVLKLEKNKYYVGKTYDMNKRWNEHINGAGALWTKKYKPIKIMNKVKEVSLFDEDKITKEIMAKYGIENVRGGSYVREILDESQITNLQKEIWSSLNLCLVCGSDKHYSNKCNKNNKNNKNNNNTLKCFNCDSKDHLKKNCPINNNKNIAKNIIENNMFKGNNKSNKKFLHKINKNIDDNEPSVNNGTNISTDINESDNKNIKDLDDIYIKDLDDNKINYNITEKIKYHINNAINYIYKLLL